MNLPPQTPPTTLPTGFTDVVELTYYVRGKETFVKVRARVPARCGRTVKFPHDLVLDGGEPVGHWQADFPRFVLLSYRPVAR